MAKQVFNYKLVRKLMNEQKKKYQGLSDFFLSKGVEVSIDVIKHWFRKDDNKRANPEIQKLPIIAEFLDVEPSQLLLGFSDDSVGDTIPVRPVPIVGVASCGLPLASEYQIEGEVIYVPTNLYSPKLYTVIACGNSMLPEISDGDKIVCDPDADVKSGDIVHYVIDGESAVKIYYHNASVGVVEFIPYNQSDDFQTLSFAVGDERLEQITRHKVVLIVRDNLGTAKERLRRVRRG